MGHIGRRGPAVLTEGCALTIQQLIYAVEAYRCGSISRAAQNLFMAQPNLSAAIRELESELGARIFHRTRQGIECTEFGKVFVSYASDVITRFDRLQNMYKSGVRQTRVLSLITGRSSEICISMTEYVNRLAEGGLPFRVKFQEDSNYKVIGGVASGEADVGILRTNTHDVEFFFKMADSKDLQVIALPPRPYVVLFSRKHPLAEEDYITQQMLRPYTEVVHGDYEMPMYPFSDYKYGSFPQKEEEKNVVFVYDRGTLMDTLANVRGSYIWTCSTHPILMETYGLVERRCDAPPVQGIDAVVISKKSPVTQEMQDFVNLLLEKCGLPPLSRKRGGRR